jgi:hypothetical protein
MPNTVAEATARRREYNDKADALDKESEVLERKIQELKTSLVSKLKF